MADDIGSIERVVVGNHEEHDQMTMSCIRTLVNTFLIAYRLVHWMQVSVLYLPDENDDCLDQVLDPCSEIHSHHVSAATDRFGLLSMFYDLPPASRLNYRHMFSGLYNCISQPVYFHNPDYERRVQLTIQQIKDCEQDINTLPVIMQVYPEIGILYDDDNFQTSLPQEKSGLLPTEMTYTWRWLVTSGRVYLFRWNPHTREHVVYLERHRNIIHSLRRNYIPHKKKVDARQKRKMDQRNISGTL